MKSLTREIVKNQPGCCPEEKPTVAQCCAKSSPIISGCHD